MHVVLFDLSSQVDVDLNPVLSVLLFYGVEEGMEPFCAAEISDDPGEVYLPSISLSLPRYRPK
jgi:hypothetical protein